MGFLEDAWKNISQTLGNPLVQEIIKVGAEVILPSETYHGFYGGGWRGMDMSDDGDSPNPIRDAALREVFRKDGSVTVWIGTRETGKTIGSQRQAEATGRPIYSISPEQRPPNWIIPVKLTDLSTIPSRVTVIMEDLPSFMSNRDYNNSFIQEIEKIIPLVRHEKKWHLIFNTQSSAQADKYILDCDLAFFKPQGMLMEDVERSGIQKIYRHYVNPFFEHRSEQYIRRHAVMKSRTYVGGIAIVKTPAKSEVMEAIQNSKGVYEALDSGEVPPSRKEFVADPNAEDVNPDPEKKDVFEMGDYDKMDKDFRDLVDEDEDEK